VGPPVSPLGDRPGIGVVLPQAEIVPSDPDAIRGFVAQVEALGFDHLLAFDHVLGADSSSRPGWDGHYDHTTPFLEPLTLFAFLGAVSRLEMVTGIMVLPQRQTALVAKQAATLDVLLGGRLRLGVGIGWNAVEYEALGVTFGDRGRRMEEQIPLLRRLWTEPVVDHHGDSDRIDRAAVCPLPVQQPIPVWIGCGDAPVALERVGRLADGWIPHPALGAGRRVGEGWNTIRRAAEAAGRDPDALGLHGQVSVVNSDLDRISDRLGKWMALGATHVSLNTLEAGLRWPEEHGDACARVAQRWTDLGFLRRPHRIDTSGSRS
jgi:probable F420-dependent oxidoreductase